MSYKILKYFRFSTNMALTFQNVNVSSFTFFSLSHVFCVHHPSIHSSTVFVKLISLHIYIFMWTPTRKQRLLCGRCDVTLLLQGVARRRRPGSLVAVVVPGRGGEPGGGGDGMWRGGVAQALVPPTGGRGGGHGGGRHEDGVLRVCREEAGVLGVLGPHRRTKVHLVGTTEDRTT